jgi:hypothetical protein
MRESMRTAMWVCVLLGMTLLALASYRIWEARESSAPADALVFESTVIDVGNVPLGSTPVEFKIQNTGTSPRRIIGRLEVCSSRVCIGSGQPLDATIAANSSYNLICELHVQAVGPFESSLDVYLDDFGLRTVTLTVRGVGIAPGSAINGSELPKKP